jgi:penicillin-binding protein 1C
MIARRLEMTRDKDWILSQYFDRLDYGQLRRGPTEAARHFFQKPLADLSLSECALLAGLPQAPSRLDPLRHPERATQAPRHRARPDGPPLRLRPGHHHPRPAQNRSACARSGNASTPRGSPAPRCFGDTPPPAGTRTTIDLPLQQQIERIVTGELARLADTNARHAAVVVLDNPTGEILALVSSGDWHDPRGGQINGALLPRSPGSALKPFTYLLAFENTGSYPGSILPDVPTRFRTAEGLDAPENYDHIHHGPVTIRRALACSLNVSAMRQLNQLGGPEPLHRLLTELGLTTIGPDPAPHGLGLTLGNAPVRLLDLTNAYATLARQGQHLPPTLLSKTSTIKNQKSDVIDPPHFSPTASFLIADILSDPAARAPAFGPAASIRLPFRCAVKTGTSSDVHDNWCLGYTPDLTVGVWVGNFEHDPMTGISGITGAGPIFRRSMLAAHDQLAPTWFRPPETLTRIEIDPRTGKRIDESLGGELPRRSEWCPHDRLPLLATAADYDDDGRARLGPEFNEWFESAPLADRSRFTLDATLPPPRPLRVLAPHDGATYLLDPELPTGGRRLRLVTNFPGLAEWSSETLSIEPTEPEPTALLQPGTHTLTATDPRTGDQHQVTIHVDSL